VAERLLSAEARDGAQAVWPYYYAGTMGLVMRDGIQRLRHAKKYSGFHSTYLREHRLCGLCGRHRQDRRPADPREMAKSDLVVDLGAPTRSIPRSTS